MAEKEKLKNRDHLYIIYIKKRHDSILIIPERNWTLAISDLHQWNVYVALNGKGKKKRRTIFFEEGVVIIDASQGEMDKNLTQKSCTI